MANLLEKFIAFVNGQPLFLPGDGLLLAVSGGADSAVLCELCSRAGYDFVIAHCNFQLRGAESERDEQFVRSLGDRYGKQVLVKRFDTAAYARQQKVSVQVAARELRYNWFDDLLENQTQAFLSLRYILTAHHLDDNIETSVMHFFKGTGISGLRGMLPKQGRIIRPLLFADKKEIQSYAAETNLEWVEDSSNKEVKYTRNYVRHAIIPLMEKIYPGVQSSLAANLQRFRDTELLYRQAIAVHEKKLLEKKGDEVHIPVLKLKKSVPLHSIVYEIIKKFGFNPQQVPEVIQLLDAVSGKYLQSPSHRLFRHHRWLVIAPLQAAERSIILVEGPGKTSFPGGTLALDILPVSNIAIPQEKLTACLDAGLITFPLVLRKWKPGDYFYPLGMQHQPGGRRGKKKLARFFIDQKLSITEKENVWVLEANKKIIWVIGYRIDDRFKITESTKTVLKITTSSL
jgi:tRNA(Ile)-lysidine synthase